MIKENSLTKTEAIKKTKTLRIFIDILYETFPPHRIPHSYWDKGVEHIYYRSPPPVFFYFEFYETSGSFMLHCTNYCVWRDPDYQLLIKDFKQICKEDNFAMHDCYSWYGNIYSLRKKCAETKQMLIEKKW
jgi:hypothetical protein